MPSAVPELPVPQGRTSAVSTFESSTNHITRCQSENAGGEWKFWFLIQAASGTNAAMPHTDESKTLSGFATRQIEEKMDHFP
ncbi:uncharacterized protein N7473_006645 [Penicillium subrubescens]|uniref:Uncharacterized protein n=1 Tax=Penicillium subrubescens TaxID=1316194 RepID=A0A1Q5SWE5_9EURO|nr:uncharacterized protein N7473_006645 [Penicillium subrubescens]KAJ5890417.1 hypothetical protein N7473_006645 [Penicillium subrubescens]OKO92304.1 hypothetical protein PENSUB_12866 [Penicillium subrubescens]